MSSYSSEKVNSKVKLPPFPSMAWTEGFRPQAISDSDSDNYDSDPGFDQTLILIPSKSESDQFHSGYIRF